MTTPAEQAETDIAIVGMAGRFPGAGDVDALWRRVAAGDDCLADLHPDELVAAGVPADVVADPAYVRRGGRLDDVAGFDPAFFGIGERDAAVMDPQHRHFLECAWEALESAGHVPERFAGAIGVFGGSGMNTYLVNNLLTNPTVLPQLGWFLLRHTGNDKDFLTNGVAYRLDLHGPAVNVQTACSTSLVAVHLAVQSLLSFECDLALAGGATIEVPHGVGYQYRDGEILAPDGRCRAFDARSAGTVLTSGVGVVALRRLADALDGRDPILAVIKGTAINNDGSRKVSFFAPSVDGHADVVREALTVAGLSARDLQLLEAHGTGTAVGDPVEVAALTEAFRSWTTDRGFCRITSTKPNIGHLDTAAGVASLIKVVQALRHRVLPPLANHTGPSPLLDLERSPFTVSGEAAPWPGDAPRRAGVSSLGVGGTNAHVVVEEAPAVPSPTPGRREQILVLSARTGAALDQAAARLADHLEQASGGSAQPAPDLADVAATLATGRRALRQRLVVTATDTAHAVELLRAGDRHRVGRSDAGDGDTRARLGFLFPGGGSQYPGMGAGLDDRFSTFHDVRRRGVDLVRSLGGPDLAPLLLPGGDAAALRRPTASLPAVFVTSVALARQWLELGATPDVLVGHSLGEYVAAHLSDVLSFDDAVGLVVARSQLMERASGTGAAMLVVTLPEDRVRELLPPTLSLAAVNAADECVVAGPAGEIERFAAVVAQWDGAGPLLPLSAAAHSSLLDPVLPEFLDVVRQVSLSAPTIPYPSNLTGDWVTAAQATDPAYWVDHLRGTVRFADCLATALTGGPTVLSELGPGQALSSYARRARPAPLAAIPVLRHPDHHTADTAFTAHAFARQWAAGADVDVAVLAGDGRLRVPLPTYPFQHQRYWIEPGAARTTASEAAGAVASSGAPLAAVEAREVLRRIDDLDAACWLPTFEAAPPVAAATRVEGRWLLLADDGDDLARRLATELTGRGAVVTITSEPGDDLGQLAGVVVLGPVDGSGPAAAAVDADHVGPAGEGVAPLALVDGTGRSGDSGGVGLERSARRWLDQLGALAVELGGAEGGTRLVAVTRGALAADGPAARPADAVALGVTLVAPREYPGLASRLVDVDPSAGDGPHGAAVVAALVDELVAGDDPVVAHRGGVRLVPALAPRPAEAAEPDRDAVTFRDGGTYVITGGLGGVGHVLATHLVTTHRANLVLVSSAPVPPPADRERWLGSHALDDPTSRRIRQLVGLEQLGTKVAVVVADLADAASLRRALDEGERLVGPIDGAVHAAGVLRDRLLALGTPEDARAVLGAKAAGAVALVDELGRRGAELAVLVSSTSTALAPSGQAAYVAANAILDALAGTRDGLRVATVGFGVWAGVGMAATAARRARLGLVDGDPVEHPVLGERRTAPDGSVELSGRLDARHHWVLDEHRSAEGGAVLPGTAHVELMLAAAHLAGLPPVHLAGVSLVAPLVVPDGTATTVRVTLDTGAPRTVRVESDGGDGWMLHSEARLEERLASDEGSGGADADGGRAIPDPEAELAAGSLAPVDPLLAPRRRLELGPRWDAVVAAGVDGDRAVARLALDGDLAAEAGWWRAHPALVDVATAVAVTLGRSADPEALHVPVSYGRVGVDGSLPPALTVEARRDPASTGELLRADVVGLDGDGRRVLEIDGLELLAVPAGQGFGSVTVDSTTSTAAVASAAPTATAAGGRHGGEDLTSLVDLADRLGLRPAEGVAVVERLLAGGHDRLLGSTIDLEVLRRRLDAGTGAGPDQSGTAASSAATGASVGPAATVEDAVRGMWCDLLGLEQVDDHADFFELGGHSLIAVRLMARVQRELDVRLQLAELFEASTVAALAARVREERPGIDAELAARAGVAAAAASGAGRDPAATVAVPAGPTEEGEPATMTRHLVAISKLGEKRPLYVVHGAGGNVLFLWSLARALPGRPVYGFQAHGIQGADMPDPSIEAMAERYVAELRAHAPGPYLLGGFSGGSLVALEMVQRLRALGEDVDLVVLFDSVPQGEVEPSRWRGRANVARHLARHGVGPLKPYLRNEVKARVRRFRPRPERQDEAATTFQELGYGDTSAHGFVNLYWYFTAAAEAYRMGTYDVDAVVLKADEVWPTQPEDYHWRRHVTGRLEVRSVPGDHHSMFFPEHAPRLASTLAPLLDERDGA